jgi:hypothetical protein
MRAQRATPQHHERCVRVPIEDRIVGTDGNGFLDSQLGQGWLLLGDGHKR